jgi:SAM-dependent methyltransferase
MMIRLDFGGRARRVRALRVDRVPREGVHILADLRPDLPFCDESVDEVFLERSLAHVEDFVGTLEELWRICKPGALIHLRLPHGSSSWAVARDPRHSRAYALETFNYFDPRYRSEECSSKAAFRVEQGWLHVAGARGQARGLALARGLFATALERLVNQSRGMQYRWERWFAPLIGGFEELSVVLSVLK